MTAVSKIVDGIDAPVNPRRGRERCHLDIGGWVWRGVPTFVLSGALGIAYVKNPIQFMIKAAALPIAAPRFA